MSNPKQPNDRRLTRSRFLVSSATALGSAYLAACGSSSNTTSSTDTGEAKVAKLAPDTGQVRIMTWETYHDDPWLKEYERRTGVEVIPITAASADEMFAKAKSGTVDLDIGYFDLGNVPRFKDAGLIQPVDLERLRNLKNISPGLEWRKPLTIDGQSWGVPYNWGTLPLMWNGDVVSSPDSWTLLWDAEFKGKVSVIDDSYQTLPMVALAQGIPNPYDLDDAGFEQLRESLKSLRPQLKTLTTGFDDATQLFASGDVSLGYCPNVAVVNDLRSRSRAFAYGYPKEGTPFWIDNAILFENGNRKEVYDFIDSGLSVAWQSRFITASRNCGILSAREAQASVDPAVLKTTEVLNQDRPGFWEKMSPLVPPNDFDRRLEIWNEFKAGV